MFEPTITEISGVDHPAHLTEGWIVQKALDTAKGLDTGTLLPTRDPSKGSVMPITDEARAALDPEVAEYVKSLEAAAVAPAPVDDSAEEFEKAMAGLPPAVRKAMVAQQRETVVTKAQLKALTDEREDAKFEAMAKALVHLPGVGDGFASVMRKAAESNPAAFEEVFKVLKSADTAVEQSGFYKEIGTGHTGAAPGEDEIIAIAKAAVAKDPSLDLSEEIAKAADANPDLYAQHRKEN